MSKVRSKMSKEANLFLDNVILTAKLLNYKVMGGIQVISFEKEDKWFHLDSTLLGETIVFTFVSNEYDDEKMAVSNKQKIDMLNLLLERL